MILAVSSVVAYASALCWRGLHLNGVTAALVRPLLSFGEVRSAPASHTPGVRRRLLGR